MPAKTFEITVYTFDLLSGKAKERARDWWREIESKDPAWLKEHCRSKQNAVDYLRCCVLADEDIRDEELFDRLEEEFGECARKQDFPSDFKPTGYADDYVWLDAVKDILNRRVMFSSWERLIVQVEKAYEIAWEAEMDFRFENEYVDDEILENEYYFYESGEFYE